jgi:hypothetical protein
LEAITVRSAKSEVPGTELAKLTDPERQAASERFRVILPFLEASVPLKRIAEEPGKSLRSLRYWVASSGRTASASPLPQMGGEGALHRP